MKKVVEPTGGMLFRESQPFPKWLRMLTLSPVVVTLALTLGIGLSVNEGRKEMWLALLIVIPPNVLLFVLFRATKLEKVVTRDGLFYRWLPYQRRYTHVARGSVERTEIRKGPRLKYGRASHSGYGRINSMNDGDGIQLYLRNGKMLFFGTAEPRLFQRAIKEVFPPGDLKLHYGER